MSPATTVPTDTMTTLSMLDHTPGAVYRRLRRETPIVRLAALGRIVFTKAEDTHRVKTDAEHFGSHDTTTPMQRAFRGHTLMRKDGPGHLCERQAMAAAFTQDVIKNHWRPGFEKIVDDLLDALPRGEVVDLYSALANPLAARYLRLVLGVDTATDAQLQHWAHTLIQGAMNAQFRPDIFALCDAANDEMDACFDQMTVRHRKAPNYSVLSVMANAENPLPRSQIGTNMRICIGGALVETRDGLLSTLYGLLTNPEQTEYCLTSGKWSAACEEGLRWVAPIQASPRLVLKSVVIRGKHIPAGETVMAIQASANHDEDIWPDPHLFNVHRPPVRNQTFGDGAHGCPGGDIYRTLIAELLLAKLFERFPGLSLARPDTVQFRGFAFRGPVSLPVILQ